jgi:hypothetical protein
LQQVACIFADDRWRGNVPGDASIRGIVGFAEIGHGRKDVETASGVKQAVAPWCVAHAEQSPVGKPTCGQNVGVR